MIDVEIDQMVPAVLKQFFSSDMMETIIDDLATGARAKWISLARQNLSSSKEAYINGIQEIEAKPGERVITLAGWLPNAVESGISGYDMRMTLLGPGKGRRSASGGYYRAIPFRHGSPGSAGLAGTPMGSRYGPRGAASLAHDPGMMGSDKARALGESIWAAAKRLGPKQRLHPGLAPRLSLRHKTDIFAGMVRVKKTYKKATGAKYMTFRTISTKSGTGWLHPGIQGRFLAEQVEAWVEQAAHKMLKRALGALGR